LGLITAIEVGVFQHYDHLLVDASKTTASTALNATVQPTVLRNIQLLQNNLAAVSDTGQSFAYVDPHEVLHVVDLQTGQEIYHLQLLYQPVYLSWIRDDSLFIGTTAPDGQLQDLRLSTISLIGGGSSANTTGNGSSAQTAGSTGATANANSATSAADNAVRLLHVFTGYGTNATFKQIAFSPYTNDVYILIASSSASLVYHYGTNGNLENIDLGGRYVTDVGMTRTAGVMYFQDLSSGTPNVWLFSRINGSSLVQRNAVIVRVLGNDLYYGSVDSSGNVTAVYKDVNGKSSLVSSLTTPMPQQDVFVNDEGQVMTVSNGQETNVTTGQTNSLNGAQVVHREDALIFLSPNGTAKFVL
jgi:hypothetical protein